MMAVTMDGKFLYSVIHDQAMTVFETIKHFSGDESASSVAKNKNSGGKHTNK